MFFDHRTKKISGKRGMLDSNSPKIRKWDAMTKSGRLTVLFPHPSAEELEELNAAFDPATGYRDAEAEIESARRSMARRGGH